ncbi:Thioesterase/thiol ester dehydrase-isomerase [Xylariaceae sp. FL0804]|nr:Thioesterase/thiol ester dehydrase-isomerase [Xylariaceae sp. FL0804]
MGSKSVGLIKDMAGLEGIERIKEYMEYSVSLSEDPEQREWSGSILPHLSIISHSSAPPHPRVTFRLTVQPAHANGLRNLHGGCASTIFDVCTTLPLHLIAKPGYWEYLGVSRTLNVTFLRPVPVGTTVDIECEIVQAGKSLCTLRGTMRAVTADGKPGPVLAICEHGKVSIDPTASRAAKL